jgi:hypothetical protein
MKLSAVTEHNTDPNMIITIVSIGRGLLPRLSMYQTLAAGAFMVGHAGTRCGVPFGRSGGRGTAYFFSAIIGLKLIPLCQMGGERP